jgi:hypothetical protein
MLELGMRISVRHGRDQDEDLVLRTRASLWSEQDCVSQWKAGLRPFVRVICDSNYSHKC